MWLNLIMDHVGYYIKRLCWSRIDLRIIAENRVAHIELCQCEQEQVCWTHAGNMNTLYISFTDKKNK